MDKLRNINRAGGYPLCQENLKIIADNMDLFGVVMASMGIGTKALLIPRPRSISEDLSGNPYDYYCYYSPGGGYGAIYHITSGADIALAADNRNTYAKLIIDEVSQNVTDGDNNTINEVYSTR